MITHMTAEDLATIVRCDLHTLSQAGETTAIEVIKRCVKEIRSCWAEMDGMKARSREFTRLLEPPEGNSQLKNGAKMWYE